MNRLYIVIVILTLILTGYFVYNKLAFLNVVVSFDELEPFEKQLPVYYKGFKVVKSVKVYPDKHYKNTFVKLKLYPADVELPNNISARIQKSKRTDYFNLIAPDEASVILLKDGDTIKGELSKDINKILSEQLSDGSIDNIIDDASTLMESANVTVQNLGDVFAQISSILTEIRGDIILASSNIAKTTTNLENMSDNLNKSLDKESMTTSVGNIEQTTENIKDITSSLNDISIQIDKTTMPIVNSVLCQTYSTVKNTNEITGGIKNTLKKRLGLAKIMFGRPISNNCE